MDKDKRVEYIIVGDVDIYGKKEECLAYLCGTKERADEVLERMLNNPNEQDEKIKKSYENLRIKEVESKNCWWNDPFLCN